MKVNNRGNRSSLEWNNRVAPGARLLPRSYADAKGGQIMVKSLFTGALCLVLLLTNSRSGVHSCGLQINYKPVCYYVVSNEIERKERNMKILMDEADFTENNLRILVNHFFDKYPEPEWMSVSVATHITQMGCCATTEGPGKLPGDLHSHAGFYRKDGNEFIRYTLPDKPLRGIVITGEDPLHVSQESFTSTARTDPSATTRGMFAPLCYYIVFDEVAGKKREITIFMDEGDFTEPNLNTLITHFFEKHPKLEWLEVKVLTHIYQLFDSPSVKGPGKKLGRLHPYGLLYRKEGNEIIRYKLPDSDPKTVVIKGRDPLTVTDRPKQG